MSQNESEELLAKICKRSFLSLWAYPNPQGKKGKELCDALVVFGPHILVFSIKDISYAHGKDPSVAIERWKKKAIDESIAQLDGASRWLESATHVVRKDGTLGVPLPEISERRVHRIAVALGSDGHVPIGVEAGHENLHVMTEAGLLETMQELDTVTDFLEYLEALEELSRCKVGVLMEGADSDLTAYYLLNGRAFPEDVDFFIVQSGYWQHYEKLPERRRKLEADRVSYVWDKLIEEAAKDAVHFQGLAGDALGTTNRVLGVLARESRFNRRHLGGAFDGFLRAALAGKSRARRTMSPSGVGYLFVQESHSGDRMMALRLLEIETFLAKRDLPEATGIVGVLLDRDNTNRTASFAFCFREIFEWSAEDQEMYDDYVKMTGNWAEPIATSVHSDEFPVSSES